MTLKQALDFATFPVMVIVFLVMTALVKPFLIGSVSLQRISSNTSKGLWKQAKMILNFESLCVFMNLIIYQE
jgi:hypothetical protein